MSSYNTVTSFVKTHISNDSKKYDKEDHVLLSSASVSIFLRFLLNMAIQSSFNISNAGIRIPTKPRLLKMENSLFWTMKDVFIIQIPCLIISRLWISNNRWSECANIKVLIILYQSYLSFWSVKYSGKFMNYLKSLEGAFFNKVWVNVLKLKRFKTQSNK